MSISSIGALAQSLVPGQSARKVTPALGLTFRFTVSVPGMRLGSWQSCAGLKVDYKPVEMKSGGSYHGARYLAGEAAFPKVVLRRAAAANASGEVRTWLKGHADTWLDGGTESGVEVTITMFDSNGDAVMWWRLAHARPAGWSVSDLDATTSKVAIETLELVHEGLTSGSGKPTSGGDSGGSNVPEPLVVKGPSGEVRFTYPPTEIQVMRASKSRQPTPNPHPESVDHQPVMSQGSLVDATGTTENVTTYVLNNLVLTGKGTLTEVAKLTEWATGRKTKPKGDLTLPDITFTWGRGFNKVPVRLASLSVSYTRFTTDGTPSRAKVSLKLEQTKATPPSQPPPAPGGRNPTSGGIAGRATHLMLQSESLPSVAGAQYGDASRWRNVAAANGIDDPLRVAPGTTLYLPADREVES
jgi:phage tail-like protein